MAGRRRSRGGSAGVGPEPDGPHERVIWHPQGGPRLDRALEKSCRGRGAAAVMSHLDHWLLTPVHPLGQRGDGKLKHQGVHAARRRAPASAVPGGWRGAGLTAAGSQWVVPVVVRTTRGRCSPHGGIPASAATLISRELLCLRGGLGRAGAARSRRRWTSSSHWQAQLNKSGTRGTSRRTGM